MRKNIKDLTIEEFTTPCSLSVRSDVLLKDVEKLMEKEGIRHVPVMDDQNNVVGIVSERDLYCAYRVAHAGHLKIQDIMRKDPYIVDENAKMSEVAFIMSEQKIGSVLVRNSEGEIGIFTSIDALNALIEIVRGEV